MCRSRKRPTERTSSEIANLFCPGFRLYACPVDQDDCCAVLGQIAGDDFAGLTLARHAREYGDLSFERRFRHVSTRNGDQRGTRSGMSRSRTVERALRYATSGVQIEKVLPWFQCYEL